MSDYTPPLADMRFVLHELVGLDRISVLPGCEQVNADLVDAVLEEAGKFASDVLAPLNPSCPALLARSSRPSSPSTALGCARAHAYTGSG